MAERNPSNDRAAFGVFPQLKRNRSKQDREAAKNVPVDLARGAISGVLGAPGDIESLIRMLPYIDEKTILPTSEDIEKKLPFRSDTPVSRAATGLGTLGGGFYYGPGSPLRVAGALPKAIKHGAEEFAKASVAGVPHVIKPVGGNWLKSSVEDSLRPLKRNTPSGNDPAEMLRQMRERYTPEELSKMQEGSARNIADQISTLENSVALNKWVEGNLANYVKKQMGTVEDPVRKLAEEGVIHIPSDEVGINRWKAPEHRFNNKTEQLGQSPAAKAWEDSADMAINPMRLKDVPPSYRELWMDKASPDTQIAHLSGVFDNNSLGFDHIMDVLRQDVAEGRIRPDQLNKVSMEQAVRRTFEYDQEMAKRMREAAAKQQEGFPVHKEYPEGYRWIELTTPKPDINRPLPEGFRWLEPKNGYQRLEGPSADDPNRIRTYLGDTKEQALDVAYQRSALSANSQKMLEDALKYEGNSMGHCVGGYCPDVLEGRSRIFSLRDAKGEPHVTIETGKAQGRTNYDDMQAIYNQAQQEANEKNFPTTWEYNNFYNDRVKELQFAFLDKQKAELPERIVQIKGKQNAAPKADYLPYVQDFVKSGNWSDVGDIKNTGLYKLDPDFLGQVSAYMPQAEDIKHLKQPQREEAILKAMEANELKSGYITREEYENAVRKYGSPTYGEVTDDLLRQLEAPIPPAEGMKRGGVAISKNPDTMMLELNDRKMAGGGLTKLLKGAKEAVKAEPEIMKASEALGKIEGRPLVITQADRTKVGEGYLGGPGFSSLQLTEPEYRAAEAAWGVKTPGVAKMILGGAKKAGDKPVFTTMIGSPTQHQSNQMVFDKLYGDFKKAAKKGGLPTELRDKINDRLVRAVDKEGNPVFPADIDILDKKFKDIANTFDRRSIAGHLMGGVQVGGKKGQIIDYDKIIRETTDPALIDVPSGSLGNRLFTLSGGIIDRPDLHPAFPTILQGEDLGLQFSPVAKDILMRDFIEKTMREKGRKPGYMDFTRGHPPSQLITEDILTEMQKLGLKEGGEVTKPASGAKQPAAYIDGNEFVLAAKKYGIKDSMNNLNKIVDLVNKGLSVDDAARQVADTGMHKAAGGAITGDDLIIEERPL